MEALGMEVQVRQGEIQAIEADAIVVNLFEGIGAPGGATAAVDQALGGQISRLVAAGDFQGKLAETVVLYPAGGLPAPRVIVVGLGKADRFGLEQVRRASAAATKVARDRGARRVATLVHGAGSGGLEPADAAQATVEGALLALYTFRPYKSDGPDDDAEPRREIESLVLVDRDATALEALRAGASPAQAVAAGVTLARDLANHPSNVATPTYLAGRAEELAARHGMRLEVWDRARIVGEGMGAFASVAKGSDEEPRFIVLEHAPAGTADRPPHVLVGKGLTFDSGGISLKGGAGMGAMKFDMAGSAAVLGAMDVVGRLQLPLHVYGLVAATENMPGGHATKPGDIVTALNGTTIEILNTDAEGRLVLADALAYAQRLKPAAVVDVATLTGAIVTALGHTAAGLFCNDDGVASALVAAGERTGERMWRMPMWDEYGELIKSEVADIQNISESQRGVAGSVFGGKFLERFVDYPWAHLDIAGMGWDAKKVPYIGKGATGYGVRLLVEWLRAEAAR
jgi:leucyl aminopeptidase